MIAVVHLLDQLEMLQAHLLLLSQETRLPATPALQAGSAEAAEHVRAARDALKEWAAGALDEAQPLRPAPDDVAVLLSSAYTALDAVVRIQYHPAAAACIRDLEDSRRAFSGVSASPVAPDDDATRDRLELLCRKALPWA